MDFRHWVGGKCTFISGKFVLFEMCMTVFAIKVTAIIIFAHERITYKDYEPPMWLQHLVPFIQYSETTTKRASDALRGPYKTEFAEAVSLLREVAESFLQDSSVSPHRCVHFLAEDPRSVLAEILLVPGRCLHEHIPHNEHAGFSCNVVRSFLKKPFCTAHT